MKTRLILTIEKSVVEQAKEYAKAQGKSLSDIIQSYLSSIISKKNTDISPRVAKLSGAVNLPEDFNEKEAIIDILAKKHLRQN